MQDRSAETKGKEPEAEPKAPGGRAPGPAAAVLRLQAGAGNRAVAQLARATQAPPGAPSELDTLYDKWAGEDVEKIVELLKQQYLSASEEQRIVGIIEHAAGRGDPKTFDRFLLKLKTRVFSRRTARSGWVEQWFNAYELLWHELEGTRRERFKALVARSEKHGTSGPEEAEASENLWKTLGKHEAMGVWGMLKGMGLVLTGVADAAVWAYWKQSGKPLAEALAHFGVKVDASKAPELTPWMKKNYDDVAAEMGRAMGVDPNTDKTLAGQSSYEIGEFGGKIVGMLTLAGAGGGGAGKTVAGATKVLGVLGALKGLEDSGQKFADRLTELMLKDPPVPFSKIVTDEALLLEVANMLGNILGAVSGAGDAAPAFAKAIGKFGLVVDAAQLAPTVGKLVKDWNDPELAKDPEKREAEIRDDIATIIGTVLSTAGSKYDEHAETKKAAEKAKQNADFDAKYNQREAAPGTGVRAPLPETTLVAGAEGMHEFTADQLEAAGKADVGKERLGTNDALSPEQLGDKPYKGKEYDQSKAPVNHAKLQETLLAKLKPTGPDSLVKIVPAHYGEMKQVKGYVTQEKFVAGRTPEQLAKMLGVESLKDGVTIYRVDVTQVKPQDLGLRGYTQSPGGKAPSMHSAEALLGYPVGTGAPQWDLLRPIDATPMKTVGPGEKLNMAAKAGPGAKAPGQPKPPVPARDPHEFTKADLEKPVDVGERSAGSPGTAKKGGSESRSGGERVPENLDKSGMLVTKGKKGQAPKSTPWVGKHNRFNPAEVALSARWDYDPELGVLRSVEWDLPRKVGNEGTRPDDFVQDADMKASKANQPSDASLTNSGHDRGHGAGQQFSAGDPDVAGSLMTTLNMWPQAGNAETGVNQGVYKSVEEHLIAVKAKYPDADLRVRVEAQIGDPPKTFTAKSGAKKPIVVPDGFVIQLIHTPQGGKPQVIQTITVANKANQSKPKLKLPRVAPDKPPD